MLSLLRTRVNVLPVKTLVKCLPTGFLTLQTEAQYYYPQSSS